MECNGSETSLTECANAGVHIHDCDHSEDAGVICEGTYINVFYVRWWLAESHYIVVIFASLHNASVTTEA